MRHQTGAVRAVASDDDLRVANGPTPVRVISLLSLIACVTYLVRADVAVAQERMAPAIGLAMTGMGAITAWGFQLSYALGQVPAGMLGERIGVRTALTLSMVGCAVASLATGLMPGDRTAAVATLWITRVLLGVSQAAVYPVAAMAMVQYVPSGYRVRGTSIYIATSTLGAALAPLLMAPTLERFGWRAVFLVSAAIGGATALAWRTLMPADGAGAGAHEPRSTRPPLRDLVQLLGDRNLRMLSASYLLHSAVWFVFVFWFFRYLTEGRGFTVLASGFWGSLPSLTGFVGAPLIGAAADRLGARIGPGRARRRTAMLCLFGAASCVAIGAVLPSAVLAVTALSLSSGSLNGAEAPFFMTAAAIGGSHPAAAAGVLNLMGNLGGVLSIWLVPYMSAAWGWQGTLAFWSAACVAASLLWLFVNQSEHEKSIDDR